MSNDGTIIGNNEPLPSDLSEFEIKLVIYVVTSEPVLFLA